MANQIVATTEENHLSDQRSADKSASFIPSKINHSKRTYDTKSNSCLFICGFILFTCISMIVGITIICLSLPDDTNKLCRHIFKRSSRSIHESDSHPHHVAVGDFNHDSYLDIVVANMGTDTIGIFLNFCYGTFAPQKTYSTGSQSRPHAVAVGHFNSDTFLDIIVANYDTHNIGVFLGYGSESFMDNQIITSSGSARPRHGQVKSKHICIKDS